MCLKILTTDFKSLDKSGIQMMEDCIRYLYDHHVAMGTEYTDWSARKAVQELCRERWGQELG